MPPRTRRKVKAFMVLAMMFVAEGRRIELESRFGDAVNGRLHGATSSNDPDTNHKALKGPLELDTFFNDPRFVKQIEAMAGHMGKSVDLMKSKPSVSVRANEMTKELARLTDNPSAYPDSMLPKQMEEMFHDLEFKEQAQAFAQDMEKSMKEWESGGDIGSDSESDREGLDAALSTQQAWTSVAEKLNGLMHDMKFHQHQERVLNVLDSLVLDSDLQRQAQSIAAYVESLKDSTRDPDEVEIAQVRVSEQVDAMMANAKLRGMAADIVFEMLQNDAQDLDADKLINISENPLVLESGIREIIQKSQNTSQASLLEVGPANEEDVAPAPLVTATPFSAALKPSMVRQHRSAPRARFGPATTSKAVRNLGPRSRHPHLSLATASTMRRQPALVLRVGNTALKAARNENQEGLPGTGTGHNVFDEDISDVSDDPDGIGCSVDDILNQDCSDGSALTSAEELRSMMPSLVKALPREQSKGAAASKKQFPGDFSLLLCLAIWYLGNFFYSVTNKRALMAAGGVAGFPMTIATLQLGVGAVYALFMWLAPDARKKPDISFKDYVATLPLSFVAAGAHAATVFALSAGSVSFAQIVKASEPAFAAVIGTLLYGTKVSKAKWLTLIPVIGGVCLASLGELNFALAALVTASLSNVFAALKANENSKLMSTPGLSKRIGSVGNQFALTTINSFLITIPLMLLMEGHKLGDLLTLMATDSVLPQNLVLSGLWSYVYNEFATRVVKKTNPVTRSVASTAGRVIFIVAMALVMKESLSPLKLIGSGMGIGGVYLYSIIDKLVAARKEKQLQRTKPAP